MVLNISAQFTNASGITITCGRVILPSKKREPALGSFFYHIELAHWGTLTHDLVRKFYSEINVEIQAFSSLYQQLNLPISSLMCVNDRLFAMN